MPDPKSGLTTGELARKAGVSLRTIRWYTEAGLLAPVGDQRKGARSTYPDSAIGQVEKIRLFAETGMTLSDIRTMLDAARALPTTRKQRTLLLREKVMEQHLALAQRENRLRAAREQLEKILAQTQRCPACPSRGGKQDCGVCSNLAALEGVFLG